MWWCIYTLADPRTGAVRYVGEARDPKRRLSGHISQARRGRRRGAKAAWLRELLGVRLRPVVTIVETHISFADRCGRERQWIEAYVEAGADLFNVRSNPEQTHYPKQRGKRGRPTLDPEAKERVRADVRALLATCGGNTTALASLLGVSQSHAWEISKGTGGPGPGVVARVAELIAARPEASR